MTSGGVLPQGLGNVDVLALLSSSVISDPERGTADLNNRIADSYPNPSLQYATQYYALQPAYRFEYWVLAAMVRDPNSQQWRWQEDQFVRFGVKARDGTNHAAVEQSVSAWEFGSIVGHQSTTYDFSSARSETFVQADRLALGFAEVSENSMSIGSTELQVDGSGCNSVMSIDSPAAQHQSLQWQVDTCVESLLINDTVFASNTASVLNGVGWVNHSYGQLPNQAGAVFIERSVIHIAPDQQLIVERSRRRSGQGPVTVSGFIKRAGVEQRLRGVQWQEEQLPGNRFPTMITISADGLAEAWQLNVPADVLNQRAESPAGQQHGVLATSTAPDNNEPRPGIVTLYPRTLVGS